VSDDDLDVDQGSEGSAEEGAEGADGVVRPLSGIDLARSALSRAREEARARNVGVAAGGVRKRRPASTAGRRRESGDPELLGETMARLLIDRGWDVPAAAVGVTQRWEEIAGADLADHCKPDKFEDGVLSLVAESTAWATQVRLLVPTLHRRMEAVIGKGVVTRIEVRGPTRPDWRRGPLRVRGPGPRDTYG
jgi:predicted nucleic acid-binding Zn ribbon protein